MTTPPLNPPDLRAAHDRLSRQLRIVGGIATAVLVGFALLLGVVLLAAESWVTGLIVALAIVAFEGALIAFSAARDRKVGGPAGPGASSLGQVVTTAPPPQVWEAVYAALRAEGFGAQGLSDPLTVQASRSLSMMSYGDAITVRLEPNGDGRGLVTVWARPSFPMQWLAYGRNRRFANAILRAVPGVHETARQPRPRSQA